MGFPFYLLFIVGVALVAVNRYVNRKRLPPGIQPLPGPWNLPFVGRVHDIPSKASWLKQIFGAVHVWISSEMIAHDLLSKRAVIYSDRPMIPNHPDSRTSGDYLALLRVATQLGPTHRAHMLRHTTFRLLETISPSGALPNIVAFLRHLPACLSPWKQKERAHHELEDRLFRANVDFIGHRIAGQRAEPSFIRTFLESKQSTDEKERAKWGETDEAMHADREQLPTLRAVVKEVIRWRPPVPTSIPHAIEKDDIYNEYFIPAGATIYALEWYFGFGRRMCQGILVVEQDLFLTMGGMAWAFDVRKERDARTVGEVPPAPFPFDTVPRSRDKMLAMRAMCDEAAHDHELQAEDADEYEYDLFRDLGTLKFGQDANGVEIGAEQTEDIGGDDDDVDSERPRQTRGARKMQYAKMEPVVTVLDVPGTWRWA
ncbi:cytochrome P450 [Lasiosphaeria ovina]|uniref:Cytochrome P450 n=1 Tax=Lasiosphaeria ovina TaxID=92902 RepID=A0AAE0N3V5_9PEZI|nr:cytochrome P450 [Lasiosphaeria ovina]